MNIYQIIFLIVLILPFAEIYLLLSVGSVIGAFPTIFLVILTAILGAGLLRQQGFSTFQRFQSALAQGVMPAYEMVEGLIILVGGVLLLTPGFITDLIGFACLTPSIRQKFARYAIDHYFARQPERFRTGPSKDAHVLEGEYTKEDANKHFNKRQP
jgi:UPF0716 protein FxsA